MEYIGILVMIGLLVMGAPIYLSVFVAVAIIVVFALGIDPIVVMAVMFDRVDSLMLLAVPMFIWSGQLLFHGGCVRPLVMVMNSFMGHLPGGPAYAILLTTVVMAAMSSSSMAAIAGITPIMLPVLVSLGYSKRFGIGLILAGGSMANIIPPSIGLIIYGFIAETSVLSLWTAAIIPGLVQGALIGVTILFHTSRGHYQRLPSSSWGDRLQAIKTGWPVMLMPLVVLGPLYGGIATPTETSSIAVVYSLFLGVVVYRQLNWKTLWESCYSTVRIMAVIFAIIMGAVLLNVAIVYVRIPYDLTDFLDKLGLNWWVFMAVIFGAYLIMGALIDTSAITLISVPILLPTILALGISPVLYGVFVVNSAEIAVLTPPYGILLFAAAGILKESFWFVAKSVFLFYPALFIHPILIAYIPGMSLWLPHYLGKTT